MQVMVADLLGRIDPDGYGELLNDFRAEYQPSGSYEEALVARLADASWRWRGCAAMEAEILKEGMRKDPGGDHSPDALAHAFMRDVEGPNLISKLSSYEEKVQKEFHQCMEELLRCGAAHRRAKNGSLSRLASLPPATSVIQ